MRRPRRSPIFRALDCWTVLAVTYYLGIGRCVDDRNFPFVSSSKLSLTATAAQLPPFVHLIYLPLSHLGHLLSRCYLSRLHNIRTSPTMFQAVAPSPSSSSCSSFAAGAEAQMMRVQDALVALLMGSSPTGVPAAVVGTAARKPPVQQIVRPFPRRQPLPPPPAADVPQAALERNSSSATDAPPTMGDSSVSESSSSSSSFSTSPIDYVEEFEVEEAMLSSEIMQRTTTSTRRRGTRRVRFSNCLEIRTHALVLGDHPSCAGGMALELGWWESDGGFETERLVELDVHERFASKRRGDELYVPYWERRRRLSSSTGLSGNELLRREYEMQCSGDHNC